MKKKKKSLWSSLNYVREEKDESCLFSCSFVFCPCEKIAFEVQMKANHKHDDGVDFAREL